MSRRITTALTAAAITVILFTGAAAGSRTHRLAPQAPPRNMTPPSISGTPSVPNQLTSNTGTWQGRQLRYAYQWLRCDTAGANCNAIGGATASSYTLTTTDVGHTLRVIVTATNRWGS